MNSFNNLLRPCRIVISAALKTTFTHKPKQQCLCSTKIYAVNFEAISVRKMSQQKSITSFFKITPKKAAEVKEEKDIEDESSAASPVKTKYVTQSSTPAIANGKDKDDSSSSPPVNKENHKSSPNINGTERRSSKRRRLESSSGDSSAPESSPVTSPVKPEKKNKTKRQRIVSSSSEDEAQKPKRCEETLQVKVEKADTPRTYSSPKSKKTRVKVEKSPLVEKNEKVTPETCDEKEKDVKSPTPSKKKSTPTAKSKNAKVTEEKQPEKEVANKGANSMNFFIRKVKAVDQGKEDEAKVAEEDYNPAKPKYHPIDDACWSRGAPVPYLALAKTLEAIEATSARLKIVETLANYLRSVIALTPEDLLPSVYMCLNQLAPAYHSLELGIAETYLMKAIGQCTGRTLAQVKAAAARDGDLGRVAQAARATQRTMCPPPPLTARGVFAALQHVAHLSGHSSVNKKIAKIQTLYTACRHTEARYLIRSLEGKLRIGLAEQSVLQALALATALTPPGPAGGAVLDASHGLSPEHLKALVDKQSLIIKTTYCECPNYELIIPAMLKYGVAALPEHCRLTPGIPLKPMLAHPTKGLSEVFNRFENEEFTCEWKYDGERAQIHVPGGDAPDYAKAAIFSRNQEDNTSKYPDVLRRLPALLKDSVTSCVLDTEAVAYDPATKQILPFQVLSTRKRKEAVEADIKVAVCVFVFDVLYLNGRALVREPLAARRRLLRDHLHERPGEWQLATSRDCTTSEEVQVFLDEAVRGSCEGLMVKMLHGENARYDIARRSHNWLKIKKDYLEGVGDTIDAVVVGGYAGRGKRAGACGGFLLACYDADADEYQSLCKLGTGFSDRDLTDLDAALRRHALPAPPAYYRYDAAHAPDTWFAAALVWEVRCADLSLSPAHRAARGLVHPDKGISLRFPRFVRSRDDKTPEQATSARQIATMYLSQDQVKNQAPKLQSHDDFY